VIYNGVKTFAVPPDSVYKTNFMYYIVIPFDNNEMNGAPRGCNIISADLHVKLNRVKQHYCTLSSHVILSQANLAEQIFQVHFWITTDQFSFRVCVCLYVRAWMCARQDKLRTL